LGGVPIRYVELSASVLWIRQVTTLESTAFTCWNWGPLLINPKTLNCPRAALNLKVWVWFWTSEILNLKIPVWCWRWFLQVYVIDFGLAKKYRDPSTHQHIPYR
jgi:hypothetical protein